MSDSKASPMNHYAIQYRDMEGKFNSHGVKHRVLHLLLYYFGPIASDLASR